MISDIFAIRGAIAPVANSREDIDNATARLLDAIVARNRLCIDSIIFVFFTVTSDLNATFPATAARAMGWDSVPMMCALEIPVEGALTKCIRVLLLCRRPTGSRWLRKRSPRRDTAARRDFAASAEVMALPAARCKPTRVAGRGPVHVYLGEAAVLRADLAEP